MLRAFGVTDKGRVRSTNEDCFGIDAALQLCVVADGMGGHNAGEVASRLAVDAVLEQVATQGAGASWPFGYDENLSRRSNVRARVVLPTPIGPSTTMYLQWAMSITGGVDGCARCAGRARRAAAAARARAPGW